MPAILYCGHKDCGVGFAATGAIPTTCPECHRETTWRSELFALTHDDRAFLRQLCIRPDEEGVDRQ